MGACLRARGQLDNISEEEEVVEDNVDDNSEEDEKGSEADDEFDDGANVEFEGDGITNGRSSKSWMTNFGMTALGAGSGAGAGAGGTASTSWKAS